MHLDKTREYYKFVMRPDFVDAHGIEEGATVPGDTFPPTEKAIRGSAWQVETLKYVWPTCFVWMSRPRTSAALVDEIITTEAGLFNVPHLARQANHSQECARQGFSLLEVLNPDQ